MLTMMPVAGCGLALLGGVVVVLAVVLAYAFAYGVVFRARQFVRWLVG
jgi:hypothetical protein